MTKETVHKTVNKLTEISAAGPFVMMSVMVLVMTAYDIVSPDSAADQYMVFPSVFRVVNILAVLCAAVCIISTLISGEIRLGAAAVLMGAFAVCIIISTLVNGFTEYARYGVPYRYLGVFDYIICLAAYMGCSYCIRTDRARCFSAAVFLFSADTLAAAVLYDRFIGVIPAFRDKNGMSGIFFHENHYGYFLVMAVLFSAGCFLYGKGRLMISGTVSFFINLAALGINQSMGCLIATGMVFAGVLALALLKKDRAIIKRIIPVILVLAAGLAAALILSASYRDDFIQLLRDISYIKDGGNNGLAGHRRWLLWTETMRYISAHPLIGYGCEGIRDMLYAATEVGSPHCELLTYAAFFGIPAALIYTAGIICALTGKHPQSPYCRAAVLGAGGYFVSSLFGVAMFYTLPFMFCFLGIGKSRPEE